MKTYILKSEINTYPYEVSVYNPRLGKDKPEWLTDILKLVKVEDEVYIYQESIDDKGNITYQVPSINGHLYVPNDSIIAMNIGNGEVFSIKKSQFEILYEEKLSKWRRLINKITKVF